MRPIHIAAKMDGVHSDIRGAIYEEAMRMQRNGETILKLNSGNPGTFGFGMPNSIREALFSAPDRAVPYCDLRGMGNAVEAIFHYHTARGVRGFGAEDIFTGNGVSEIASMLTAVMLDAGDEMLLPTPCYPLWSNCVRIANGKPVFYPCVEANGWLPDVEALEKLITPRTRALVIINPNNPTGAVYDEATVRAMIDVAHRHDLPIISDEIYDNLVYDGVPFRSTAALAPQDMTVITLNGLSKSHFVCGFRCGWMVVSGPESAKRPLVDAVTKLAALRLCPNALMQLVIPAALQDQSDIRAAMQPGGRLFEQRKATLEALSQVEGVSVVPNQGAFYLFPKLDAERFHIVNDHQFCMELLHETKIMLMPGSCFEWDKPDHIRIVMLPEADQLAQAVKQIGAFLNSRK